MASSECSHVGRCARRVRSRFYARVFAIYWTCFVAHLFRFGRSTVERTSRDCTPLLGCCGLPQLLKPSRGWAWYETSSWGVRGAWGVPSAFTRRNEASKKRRKHRARPMATALGQCSVVQQLAERPRLSAIRNAPAFEGWFRKILLHSSQPLLLVGKLAGRSGHLCGRPFPGVPYEAAI